MTDRRDRGIPLLNLVIPGAVVLVALVSTSFFILASIRARDTGFRSECADHLSQIYRALHLYRIHFGDGRSYPPHTGSAFLTCLAGCPDAVHPAIYNAEAPLAGQSNVLKCPAANANPQKTDYRGPQLYVPFNGTSPYPGAIGSATPPDHPIACDKKGNHQKTAGGNILVFDGSIRFAEGEEFEEALNATE
jgi:hypothetical protein